MANEAHKIKLPVLWDVLCKNTDENHALNTDEISEFLALRGLNVSRKILVQDIATLCDNGYEVLSYKKKYHYYYVVNRSLETAEVGREDALAMNYAIPVSAVNTFIEQAKAKEEVEVALKTVK